MLASHTHERQALLALFEPIRIGVAANLTIKHLPLRSIVTAEIIKAVMAALVVVANVLSCLLCSMLGFLLSRLSKSLEGRRLLLVALK
jgi:hypothetical protein